MEKEQPQQEIFKRYLNLIFSRHKFISACVLLAVSAGLFYYISQPEIYQSRASIMYQQQRINVSRSMGDDKRQFDEMVKTISQQVLSRNSLEKIIKENDLYSGMRQEVPIEDVIEQMREKDIVVRLEKDRGSVFTVSFKGPDPRRVVRVTNSLAARFIEENLQLREERASETASYIQDELEMAKEKLNRQEAQMRDYKQKHYNEMPEQRSANMSRLNALQEQYQAVQGNINELENTRFLVAEQLDLRRKIQKKSGNSGDFEAEGAGEEQNSLAAARNRLQQLLTRYKDDHPAVKRLKKRIEQLESEQGEMAAGGQDQEAGSGIPDSRAGQLAAQLKKIDASLKDKRREAEEIRKKIAKYEQWIEAAPKREAEWSALTRDYGKLKEYHDKLLAQSLSADASQSLEARQKGSQFKIVDSAYTPRTPMKGTFSKILLVCLAMGLAAGAGLVLGVDLMDTSFKRANEIEAELGVPVVCALPLIVTRKEQKRNRIKNAAWYFGLAAWLVALSAAALYFWLQGDIII
ncbi:polysaccharide chain length determinant protein (PEP-CTERM system associated) [Desulfosalsimonas propionicica]|uniref:Polysaccharide chain length determinant protein (PEP-CTERM system associated) n=1 Tax=Desulfosalsimonas propionicica TaxID=332175 RepID=A0A7W0HM62_9BACT|nr:Wzz/FepE/Etk N-terminal domain-containing protein [Desulfosalsimonas propionicica]MBA2883023.1 polysaccharide chain length determinant protein (PEP-CTERM system associated) [Desulfosalsimonas propionicica]